MGFGSLIGGLLSADRNAASARDQRDWQARMSDTAHQREVRDLRRAGLNPILSATGGGGASTPPGAMATTDLDTSGIETSAMDAIRLKKELAQIDENIELTKAQKRKTDAEATITEKDIPKAQIISDIFKAAGKLTEDFRSSAKEDPKKLLKKVFQQNSNNQKSIENKKY